MIVKSSYVQFVFLLFFFSFFKQINAQEPRFRHYKSQDGLSSSIVLDIEEDSLGFIYVGLRSGLCRFDGYKFDKFIPKSADPFSIQDGGIDRIGKSQKYGMFIGGKYGLQLFDPKKEQFYPDKTDESNPFSKIGKVATMCEDDNGALWLGTWSGLVRIYSSKPLNNFIAYQEALASNSIQVDTFPLKDFFSIKNRTNIIWDIVKDPRYNQLWLATNQGLLRYDLDTGEFHIPSIFDGQSLPYKKYESLFSINIDTDYNLWMGSENTPLVYNLEIGEFIDIPEFNGLDAIVMQIDLDKDSNVWVAFDGVGVYKFDKDLNLLAHFINEEFNAYSLQENNVHKVFLSSSDLVYMGSHLGLSVYDKHQQAFNLFPSNGRKNSLPLGKVECIAESSSASVWVGLDDGGFAKLDPKGNEIQKVYSDSQEVGTLNNMHVTALCEDRKGNLWIGTWGGGLSRISAPIKYPLQENSIKPFEILLDDNESLIKEVYTLFKDSEGNIWLATAGSGLIKINIDDDSYAVVDTDSSDLTSNSVYAISEDHSKNLWISTSAGVVSMQLDGTEMQQIDLPIKRYLDNIKSIRSDLTGQIWMASDEGLIRYNPSTEKVSVYDEDHGFVERSIESIEIDAMGNLWLGSASGISIFYPESERVTNYLSEDGIIGGSVANASLNLDGHEMFFGSPSGIFQFHPGEIKANEKRSRLILTDMLISNELVAINNPSDSIARYSPLYQQIAYTDALELKYWQNSFAFKFTELGNLNPERIRYKYRLLGFDEKWIERSSENRFANFTNLDPGDYIFQLKASNIEGDWDELPLSLDICIRYPWWRQWWAYGLYLTCFCLSLILAFRIFKKRLLLREDFKRKTEEARQLRALDQFKSRLYTNLTHEFRTPLTVILGMVNMVKTNPKKNLSLGLKMIERNGKNLLRLINQLLDLSKLENNVFKLKLEQLDIVQHLEYLITNFKDYAKENGLELSFESSEKELWMDYDANQVKQILTNLISNAIKFTNSGGRIHVSLTAADQQVYIQVRDTGIGIAKAEQEKIFERFYQVDQGNTRVGEGTGIGLAHSKELVSLMGGSITMESEPGMGSVFGLTLPVVRNQMKRAFVFDDEIENADFNDTDHFIHLNPSIEKPKLLIVEDNSDISRYLKAALNQDYLLLFAKDGKEGIEIALDQIPDVIISDVMMPEKDGFELCDFLKNDERTSHIPLILLTAKSDYESKIIGLKRGADVYMAKPFEEDELKVQLKRLLERQHKLRMYFSGKYPEMQSVGFVEEKESLVLEDSFITKVRTIVEANYENEHFSLHELCEEMNMSRSQLYRKMKAIIEVSPSHYIRNYRLEKGKELLEASNLNISQIGFTVGFKDAAHFSKLFMDRFGVSPSNLRKDFKQTK